MPMSTARRTWLTSNHLRPEASTTSSLSRGDETHTSIALRSSGLDSDRPIRERSVSQHVAVLSVEQGVGLQSIEEPMKTRRTWQGRSTGRSGRFGWTTVAAQACGGSIRSSPASGSGWGSFGASCRSGADSDGSADRSWSTLGCRGSDLGHRRPYDRPDMVRHDVESTRDREAQGRSDGVRHAGSRAAGIVFTGCGSSEHLAHPELRNMVVPSSGGGQGCGVGERGLHAVGRSRRREPREARALGPRMIRWPGRTPEGSATSKRAVRPLGGEHVGSDTCTWRTQIRWMMSCWMPVEEG
jgi:hypothetical protein